MPLPIALVEDQPDLRRVLVERLSFFPELQLVLAAPTADVLLTAFEALMPRPAVVLMDLELPGIDGVEATRRLKALAPDVEVLVLTVFEDEARIFAAIQAGASGYLLKDATVDGIVEAVREVAAGGVPLAPLVARKVLRLTLTPPRDAPEEPPMTLSERELEVLRLAAEGLSEPKIAERLFLSPHTIRSHMVNVYRKLHVRSRTEAVRVAVQQRLV